MEINFILLVGNNLVMLYYLFFSPFFGCFHGTWKFSIQGLNPRRICKLLHSCSDAGSLTHFTTAEFPVLSFKIVAGFRLPMFYLGYFYLCSLVILPFLPLLSLVSNLYQPHKMSRERTQFFQYLQEFMKDWTKKQLDFWLKLTCV